MAKTSSIEKNKLRIKLSKRFNARRMVLKNIIMDKNTSFEDRLGAVMKLSELPRNGNPTRVRSRCEVSGRSRSVYKKLRVSRIALRELGNMGLIPGLVKSSW